MLKRDSRFPVLFPNPEHVGCRISLSTRQRSSLQFIYLKDVKYIRNMYIVGAWGSVVVKALRY